MLRMQTPTPYLFRLQYPLVVINVPINSEIFGVIPSTLSFSGSVSQRR
jgi:hypothetical protein